MTEKRFENKGRVIYDSQTYNEYHCDFFTGLEEISDLLNEQQSTISQLEEENDNMNLFIKQTIEPLLFNCVFELDTIESMSQVELARKIENEIIPFIQDFKYLKYESPEEEKQDKSE